MRRRFEEASDAQSDLGLRNRLLSQFAINSAASVQQMAQIATIFYGVFLIQDGIITMGAMIAAVILGGTSLFGGRGSILGTVLGAAIFSVIISGFTSIKLDAYYQEIGRAGRDGSLVDEVDEPG